MKKKSAVKLKFFRSFLFLLFFCVFALYPFINANANSISAGYEIPPGESTFTNNPAIADSEHKIEKSATQGDNQTVSGIYGVYSDHTLYSFENPVGYSIRAYGNGWECF